METTTDQRSEYEVTFWTRTRHKTFTRWAISDSEAVEEAKHGFQAAYGFWPNEPTMVRKVGETT